MKRSAAFCAFRVRRRASSLAVAGTAFAQAKFQLRWGHYLADGPFVQLEKDYAAKIEKRTNGRVKITITFAGGLGKGEELLMLTSRGAIDREAGRPCRRSPWTLRHGALRRLRRAERSGG